mmetsp:Transcript_15765/g.24514  ORF Transcript_15765/g.24514 Transcript_15765/m.24514 type:complete len:296 (-) Transcript_15765:94-981(-)
MNLNQTIWETQASLIEFDVAVVSGLEKQLCVERSQIWFASSLPRTSDVKPELVTPLKFFQSGGEVSNAASVGAQTLNTAILELNAPLFSNTFEHLLRHLGKVGLVVLLHLTNRDSAVMNPKEHESRDPDQFFVHGRSEVILVQDIASHSTVLQACSHLISPFSCGSSQAFWVSVSDSISWLLSEFRNRHVHQHLSAISKNSLVLQEILDVSVLTVENQVTTATLRALLNDRGEGIISCANVDRARPRGVDVVLPSDHDIREATILSKLLQCLANPASSNNGAVPVLGHGGSRPDA